ncbi:patatin-like phospholipase family protein [Taklimakanibacter lacteus]|uniref:patatin-like phospholipase family protein n=1 Tax=Taklimakanibacter lacteus TaxID=2268456 RepID=UPI000E66D0EA
MNGKVRQAIGLALGAGAARGWAHIGAIERLEENGIHACAIAGSSIGALAGGLHAAGRLQALKEFALGLTRRRVLSLLDISWRGSGLIAGERLGGLLDDVVGGVTFADTKIPFICIATELGTGHELWLRSGALAPAIRASYALPGVFRPVRVNGHWLIDGGVVNPVPVAACRALGARLVIAVNLGPETAAGIAIQNPPDIATSDKGRTAPSLTSVLVAAFNITQDRLARSRLAGDPPDISLSPRSNGLGLFEFDKAEKAIAAGRDAVDRAMPEIERAISVL